MHYRTWRDKNRRMIARLCRAFFMHKKKINLNSGRYKVIARLCRAFFMHRSLWVYFHDACSCPEYQVIARLCRAFFMHIQGSVSILLCPEWNVCDCPVMSGFFHALYFQMRSVWRHLCYYVIARLCRAFFMHM